MRRESAFESCQSELKSFCSLTAYQETAGRQGVRALRYTVEGNGGELAEIAGLVVSGKVKPHVRRTFRLEEVSQAVADCRAR
jgi:hypothetical protein